MTKYYYAGAQRIAMRKNGTLNYILGDHLGSTSIVTDAAGALVSQQLYTPWGETRYTSGLSPTKYQYTGQYSHTADFGLMFYNARWYDPTLGRFTQADSIVPPGVQGLDRYAYVNNNPLRYTDPSGHMCSDPEAGDNQTCDGSGNPNLPRPKSPIRQKTANRGGNISGGDLRGDNWREDKGFAVTNNYSYGFHVTPIFSGGQDMSSDDFVNGVECMTGGAVTAGCLVAVIPRIVPPRPSAGDSDINFFVEYNVTHDETIGIIVSDFVVANFSGEPIAIRLLFESGGNVFSPGAVTAPMGRHPLSNPPPFNGNNPLVIDMAYKMLVNLGSAAHPGPHNVFPPLIHHTVPSIPWLQSPITTYPFP